MNCLECHEHMELNSDDNVLLTPNSCERFHKCEKCNFINQISYGLGAVVTGYYETNQY